MREALDAAGPVPVITAEGIRRLEDVADQIPEGEN